MATITVFLDPKWSVADAQVDGTVLTYHSVAWSVDDAAAEATAENWPCALRTHRGLDDEGRTHWIPFYDKSARCSRGPLINDLYNRYYWTQDGDHMRYNTLEALKEDKTSSGMVVGVPAPDKAPGVKVPATGENSIIVDRAYVYTYVTLFGEESAPSPPSVRSGPDSGTWRIKMTLPTDDGRHRRITKMNIYRSVSTATGAEYHYVGASPIGVPVFYDKVGTNTVGLNYTLESETWGPPPDYLEGLIEHPNGFFVGFVGRDIHFSEPYRPHAWPPEYVLSTMGDIVGFGIFGTTIVVCTNSHPYLVTGITPNAMVLTKNDTAEPCVARYGIVSMPFGVYYPGPNGLMLASPRGIENATEKLMTKEEWQLRYQVANFDAARYQQQYVAFYSRTKGLMFDPGEPIAALVDLDLTGAEAEPDTMDTIFTDEYSGKTFLLDNCNMYEWNPPSGAPLEFDWTSMEFDIPEPANFGAGRIIWYSPYTPPTPEQTWAWRIYNAARIAEAPLNPLNYHGINVVRLESPLTYDYSVLDPYPEIDLVEVQQLIADMEATLTEGQIKQPHHWSPLFWVPAIGDNWPNTPYVVMQLLVNETVVYTKEVTHTKMFRLPTGFKGTRFRIRLRSNIHIQSCKIAETGKELRHI